MQRKSVKKAVAKRADRVVRYVTKDGTEVEKRYGAWADKKRQVALPKEPGERTVGDLLAAWVLSQNWRNLKPVTKSTYTYSMRYLKGIEKMPLSAVSHAVLSDQVDAIAATHVGSAIGYATLLGTMFTWGVKRQWLNASPARLLKGDLKVGHHRAWKQEHYDLAVRHVSEAARRTIVLATETTQRCSDLCRMDWPMYDGYRIAMGEQVKTGEPMVLPVTRVLKAELDEWIKEAPLDEHGKPTGPILVPARGGYYHRGNLSQQLRLALKEVLHEMPGFPKRRKKNGEWVTGLTLHGLRVFGIHRLAYAGSTTNEISRVSGHQTLRMVQFYTRGIDQHTTAMSAIAKLDAWQDAIDARFGKPGTPLPTA